MEELRIILDNNKCDYFHNHMGCGVYLKLTVKRKDSKELVEKIKELLDKELGIKPRD